MVCCQVEETSTEGEPDEVLRRAAHLFFDFSVQDPARYQLLFLRTISGFTPSAAAYASAEAVLGRLTEVLQAAGVGSPERVDLWTALFTGLASQQISNDPGGERWQRLIDTAADLFIGNTAQKPRL